MAWSVLPNNQADTESGDDSREHSPAFRRRIPAITNWFVHIVELGGFLFAIMLPFLYLPLLFVTGPEPARSLALAALIALHVIAIIVGARYEPRSRYGQD